MQMGLGEAKAQGKARAQGKVRAQRRSGRKGPHSQVLPSTKIVRPSILRTPHPSLPTAGKQLTKLISRFLSMDPVQNDLKLLGVKPLEPDDYNIHTPPLPMDGKNKFCKFLYSYPVGRKYDFNVYFLHRVLTLAYFHRNSTLAKYHLNLSLKINSYIKN